MATNTLSIESLLQSKQFTAQMKSVNDCFSKANKDLQLFGKNLQTVGTGLRSLGAAVTAALGSSVKSLALVAKEADETSRRTGLTVETVQELGYAAKRAGSDFSELENGLWGLRENLSQAGTENTAFRNALAETGLSMEELKNMTPQEQFETLTEAISGVDGASRRAGLALAVFGEAGPALLPFMAEGADGMNRLKEEAHSYGYVMSGEVVSAGSEFQQRLEQLVGGLGGLGQQLVAGMLPALNSFLEGINKVVSGLKNWAAENPGVVKTVAWVAAGVGIALGAFGGLVGVIGSLIMLMPAIGAAFTLATGPVGIIAAAVAVLVAGVLALYYNWDAVSHYMMQAWDVLSALVLKGVEQQLSAFERLLGWIPGVGETLRTAIYKVQDAAAQAMFEAGERQVQYEKEKNEKLLAEAAEAAKKRAAIQQGGEWTAPSAAPLTGANTGEISGLNDGKGNSFLPDMEQGPLSFTEAWGQAFDSFEERMLNWKDIATGLFEEVHGNVTETVEAMVSQIGEGWSGLWEIIENFGQKILDSVVNMLTQVVTEWMMKTVILQGIETAYGLFKSLLGAEQTAEELNNISTITTAKIAAAKTEVTASAAVAGAGAAAASSWSLWGAVAIGAAVMAAVMAFADGFAKGGIVGGNSFAGDRVLTRVNSGEMILNGAQQARLFDIADGRSDSSSGGGAVINQTVNVRGSGDLNALTKAIKRGTVEALEFANVAYKAGGKRNKYVG